MKSHLTGQLSAAFVICEYFHFWHLLKLAEANQAKDFPTTRRLVPTYAQCSIPSIISKSNSGVNPKERSNLRRLCLSWRVSQRGKEWLWLGTQTLVAAFPEPNPIMCTQVWAHTTKEISHLYTPDSHLQLKRNKTTEKIFIINLEANHTEIFLISRNKVKHCPLKPFLFDINLWLHVYSFHKPIENIVLILSQEFFTTLKS